MAWWPVSSITGDPVEKWRALLKAVQSQSTPVLYAALGVVGRLLLKHQPSMDDAHSTALMCKTCWETWPCDVYQVIEEELRRGE